MLGNILATSPKSSLPPAIIILVILFIIVGIPLFLLIKFILKSYKERKKLRFEISKIANELQELKS